MLQEATKACTDFLSRRENRIAYIHAAKMASDEAAELQAAREEGIEHGREEERRRFVKNMIATKLDISTMMNVSGVTEEQIRTYSA